MAQLGFGLNINDTAQENGYDQYQTSLFESLGAVAADNWNFNPLQSIRTFMSLDEARGESISQDIQPVDRNKLNKEYSDIGLYFERDEYQSVVDIMVEKKEEELERQSVMMRGPEGSWNPFSGGFYVGAAKLATGVGTSFLDPINIGASFIPVFGQARFAALVAKPYMTFARARAIRGMVEGAVGATVIEPLIYSVAQKVQADYDLMDSFMNIGFGTVLGSGLHVGAGKLRDIKTARDFEAKVLANRENLGTPEGGEPEVNFYKEYYPENSDIMMKLEKTDPRTRDLLLKKALGDQQLDDPVNVMDIANADPVLNNTSTKELDAQILKAKKTIVKIKKALESKGQNDEGTSLLGKWTRKYRELLAEREKLNDEARTKVKTNDVNINRKKISDDIELNSLKDSVVKEDSAQQDLQLKNSEERLVKLRTKQNDAGLSLKFDQSGRDTVLKKAADDLDEVNTKSKELDDSIADYINCINGR